VTLGGYARHVNFFPPWSCWPGGCEVNQIGGFDERAEARRPLRELEIQESAAPARPWKPASACARGAHRMQQRQARTVSASEFDAAALQLRRLRRFIRRRPPIRASAASDLLGGTGHVILSETPETYGAEIL